MHSSYRPLRTLAAWALFAALPLAGVAAVPARVATPPPVCVRNCPPAAPGAPTTPTTAPGSAAASGQSWGAIASTPRSYAYSYNHASRAEAESAARAQCNRQPGGGGACEVHAFFNNACGALARGNYGEWAVAVEPSDTLAGKTALAQCNSHLPTEPCKVVASICSPR